MHINFSSIVITIFMIQLLHHINRNNVQGQPLNTFENQELLSRIYNDESWSNNQNEPEYQPRNEWTPDIGDNRKEPNNDCKGGRTCGTTAVDMPIKREMFVSRGWGAGGMPFNVLYMKNPKSNKSLRSSSPIIAEPLRSQPISQAQQQFISHGPNEYMNSSRSSTGEITSQNQLTASSTMNNIGNQNTNNHSKGRSANSMLVPSRRHYSIIPQLFVSYGWGPIGK